MFGLFWFCLWKSFMKLLKIIIMGNIVLIMIMIISYIFICYVLYTIYILLWIMINEHSTYFSFLVNNMRKSQDYFFRRCWKNTGLFFLTTIFYPSVFRVISFQLLYVLFYTKGQIMCNWLYSIGLGQWKCFGTINKRLKFPIHF